MNKRKMILFALILFIIVLFLIILLFVLSKGGRNKFMLKDYSKTKDLDILILGNGFFSTTDLEETFEMILEENGKNDVTVDFLGLPYYQTSWFFNDIYYLEDDGIEYTKLRNGEYDILVLSAFYTQEDQPAIGDFVNKMSESGTEVILFPAENAATMLVTQAMGLYDVSIADWQKSLQNLKQNHGFDNENLNFDDSIPMSNGACLLYSRLYREVPVIKKTSEIIYTRYEQLIPGVTKLEKMDALDLIAEEALNDIKKEDKYYLKLKK